jgi:hypothetical protein
VDGAHASSAGARTPILGAVALPLIAMPKAKKKERLLSHRVVWVSAAEPSSAKRQTDARHSWGFCVVAPT